MRPKTRLFFFFFLGSFPFFFRRKRRKSRSLSLFLRSSPSEHSLPFFPLPVQFKGQGAIDKHVLARNDGAPFSSISHGQSDPLENPSQ